MREQPSRSENAVMPWPIFGNKVLQAIRTHARSSMEEEICGILIGTYEGEMIHVKASIQGEKASQAAAHVTFTQETWEHIYKEKDDKFPEQKIVGWYHSHPGFGVFLSSYDLFIQENFFSSAHQLAWVFDPHSDEEGAFGWSAGKVVPLPKVTVFREANGIEPMATGENPNQENIAKVTKKQTSIPKGFSSRVNAFGKRVRKCRLPISITIVAVVISLSVGFLSGFLFIRTGSNSKSQDNNKPALKQDSGYTENRRQKNYSEAIKPGAGVNVTNSAGPPGTTTIADPR